jgi:fatty acid desaturase 2 (delta-6 desaturase)
MGKGGRDPANDDLPEYPWEEIARHTDNSDKWIVVEDNVYNITDWAKRHPGGEKVISLYAGQDASDAWYTFHGDKELVAKYMSALRIGKVKDGELYPATVQNKKADLIADFREIRTIAEKAGWFEPSLTFFAFILAQVVTFELAAWAILYMYGTGWWQLACATVLLAASQIHAVFLQHDLGHRSVFKELRYNQWAQVFVMNFIQGGSAEWWNDRHFSHHSKTNILVEDPVITVAPILVVGENVATEYGRKKLKYLPYASQHKYFYFMVVPLMMPIYYIFQIPLFVIKNKYWLELFWMSTFWLRWHLMFSGFFGFWGMLGFYTVVRVVESHWAVWVNLMSHLPKPSYDKTDKTQPQDWVTMQIQGSVNAKQSFFTDWFTGHGNFQIEHHLFPGMPRNNNYKVAPLVVSMCEKHGVEYTNPSLLTAFGDIIRALKTSGEIWQHAYDM